MWQWERGAGTQEQAGEVGVILTRPKYPRGREPAEAEVRPAGPAPPWPIPGRHRKSGTKQYYRFSEIIKLDRKHPGLRSLVDERLKQRVPQRAILKELEKRYGERVSETVLSHYWTRQVGPQELELRRTVREMQGLAHVVMEEARKNPGSDAWKLVGSLVEMYIYESRFKLGEADVMALLAEQRRRKEVEIKRGHLEVAVQKLENEKKELDARLEADRTRRDQILGTVKNAESALAEGHLFDPADAFRKIAAVIGTGEGPEERVEKTVDS